MKVLVTGSTGQLGYDVVQELKNQQIECIAATRNYLLPRWENALERFLTEL